MRMTLHVLDVVRQAHDAAVLALDNARRELAHAEERREQEARRVALHERREAELRAALDGHQAAARAADARRNPEEPPAQPHREALHLDVPRTDRDDRRR